MPPPARSCWAHCRMNALRADGSAPNITAYLSRESVASVSGNGGVLPLPGTRSIGQCSASVSQLPRRRQIHTILRRATAPALSSYAVMPCALAVCAAFRAARPRAPGITVVPNLGGVVSVSGHGGVPPWPSPTRLSRSFVLQRGHASRAAPAALPLRGISPVSSRQASPLCPSRCVVARSVATAEYGPCQVLGVFRFTAAGGRRVMSHAPATGTRFAFTYCAVLQSVRQSLR